MPDPLIQRILDGDREAYAEVVAAHQDMLVGYAGFLLPDRDLAEELAHRTFIRAFEQLADFDQERELGPWLRAICRSLAQGELTRRRRELHNLGKAHAELRLQVLAAGSSEDDADGDRLAALRRCLEGLDQPLRALLAARYGDGCAVAEAAARLGRSVTWVTTTLARLRERLRGCIESRLRLGGTA
ncbi:MAG: RNA polymerase sigma factor [Planctomycetes bacterium]|nr:RNA polymerase sigma factor [Planctomycetota bacterium]